MSRTEATTIPALLIYEEIDGRPIYYRDYRDVLNGTKEPSDIMGSSTMPSFLSAELIVLLRNCLGWGILSIHP